MQEIDNLHKIYKWNTENHFHQLGYIIHFDVWPLLNLCTILKKIKFNKWGKVNTL